EWRTGHGYGPWSIQGGLGLLFQPVAWLIGAPSADVDAIGRLLATSVVATEFVAYLDLSALIEANAISERGTIVVAYALCGFANIPSLAIQVGGLSAIAPTRRAEISAIAPRAVAAGVLACGSTATVAGAFIS
ncbi:MAG: nucleoside transporter C-terminal domain-containing protein, partial [Planctomycetota bacterium]|nr:nucleoside transporter C-terminal domain-containing protein [Planctomycetota bacterium]